MESKWPFMLIAFGLVFLLGLAISGLERSSVMNNWDKRRCDFAVMAAAGFFKEAHDKRSKTQFAKDNFEFCMKTYVDKFVANLMTPVNTMMSKQMDVTEGSMGILNSLRLVTQTLYTELSNYVADFYRRFNTSVFEISRVVQYMGMAVSRINGMVMSMLYSGITLFRGMINTIQFVIKVILIICAIMIAILIVLWFVLFPVIPLIISTLGAIVTTVALMAAVISSQVADQASGSKKGFCFAKDTQVSILQADGTHRLVFVQDVKVGDVLGTTGGTVTAVLEMDGTGVPLYHIEGILVSGSHLVKGTDGQWKLVEEDERASPIPNTCHRLYCFNTTTHVIPIYSPASRTALSFRDWEEFSDEDEAGHYRWNYEILKHLNHHSHYSQWKESLTPATDMPLLSGDTRVKTRDGFMCLSHVLLGSHDVVDRYGRSQKVLGRVQGEVIAEEKNTYGAWNTELFEWKNGVWVKGKSTLQKGSSRLMGEQLMTETGEFVIWDETEKREKVIRDFTDIGYTAIHETYPLVASRLRIYA